MGITIANIVYINCNTTLEKLKFILSKSKYDFVEKVESGDSEEVWVPYSGLLVDTLVKTGHLSNQEKIEMAIVSDEIDITEILFYS